ncbi:MAG: DNA-3-methyladenine glycosylase I [Spirochaetota bacterium]
MKRCDWAVGVPEIYISYHDTEWGVPVYDDLKLFEMLILEGMQAGLSWLTILNKRTSFSDAFAGFDPETVASFSEKEMEALLQNKAIIRNKRKCSAAVTNAAAFCRIQDEYGTFSDFIWSYVDHVPVINTFSRMEDVPASTPLSERISADLKKRGMTFVGPVIIYSFMQAVGIVNDHLTYCELHPG